MLIWQNVMQLKFKYFHKPLTGSKLLFESCRSALYSVLKYELLHNENKIVYVCDFTCEAVKDAVDANSLETRRYDLNTRLTCENLCIEENLEHCIFIVQMTFGISAFSPELIQHLKRRGAVLIADCSLSLGTSADTYSKATALCDVSIYSFECSKSLSYGWGGELLDNTSSGKYRSYVNQYLNKRVNVFSDMLRILQVIYSMRFLRSNSEIANFFRKIFQHI